MAFNPNAIFNLLENDTNYRKIVATLTASPAPVAPQTWNVYFRVDGPIAPLRIPNFASPDAVLTDVAPIGSMPLVNLPLDSTGATLEGSYTLTYYVEDPNTPGVYTEVISSIVLDVFKEGPEACRLQPRLKIDTNCFCYRLTVTDETVYQFGSPNELIFDSRTMTVIPPTIPGQPTPAPIVTSDAVVTLGFDYANVTYIVNLLSVYHHFNDDETIVVQENLIGQLSQRVVCDFNLCRLVKCIGDKIAALELKAAAVGGWPNLPIKERDAVKQLEIDWMLMEMFRLCGNYNKVTEYYNRIVEIVNCDCGCQESNTDHPVAVSPGCGGGGAFTSIQGTSPVNVNIAGTTATISLDPGFVTAALAGLSTLNLTAPLQGSLASSGTVLNLNINAAQTVHSISVDAGSSAYLTATPNTPTNGNTKLTLDLSDFQWGAWEVFNDSYVTSIASIVQYSTVPLPLRVSKRGDGTQMRIDGQANILQYSSPTCLNVDIPLTLPATLRPGMPIAAFNSAGECVGEVALANMFGGGPTDFMLMFIPNAAFVAPGVISFTGIFNLD